MFSPFLKNHFCHVFKLNSRQPAGVAETRRGHMTLRHVQCFIMELKMFILQMFLIRVCFCYNHAHTHQQDIINRNKYFFMS